MNEEEFFAKMGFVTGKVDGKSYSEVRSEKAHADAKAKGCVVVVPKAHELFVDIDSDANHEIFEANIDIVKRFLSVSGVKRTRSPSLEPGHWHIVVTLDKTVTDLERIALQAVLGSDPAREALSLLRVRCGDTTPTLFFELAPKAASPEA